MKTSARVTPSGFSLVEVALSLGIAAFCLVAVFALLPIGFSSNLQASEETAATGILSSVMADLRTCPRATDTVPAPATRQFGIVVPANPVSSASSAVPLYFDDTSFEGVSLTSASRFKVEISFLPKERDPNDASKFLERTATLAMVKVSWPASAATSVGAVDTLVALDRN